ncbi:MAG: alpha-hydroxy acid oxidase [Acidobacteria bacterium]|nr:alpha-hydroxy acid oxidase [Acidobacteriota bacterium]
MIPGTFLSRRMLLRYLAGSPLLAALTWTDIWPVDLGSQEGPELFPSALSDLEGTIDGLIASADKAINVFDFASVAKKKLPPAHYGYLATGVEDDRTLRANREAFSRINLRPRRLVDVSRIDMTTDLLGVDHSSPIILAPVGSQKGFHPEGEIAVANAARTQRHLQILSTVSTSSVAEVAAARGEPVWYQLYPTSQWDIARALLQRAADAGSPVVVLTVDLPTSSNRETEKRSKKMDSRDCTACHAPGIQGYLERKPMFEGLDISKLNGLLAPAMTWEFVDRLKEATSMKVVLKGIVTREDALLSLKHGVDGLIVSNHGGRAEESGRATMESLPEVVESVQGKIPVLVDGGFRRGSDVFKALAMGASAVCIGRPYLWGLAAFGQPGVEMVLKILRAELRDVMMFSGTPSLGDIRRSHVGMA